MNGDIKQFDLSNRFFILLAILIVGILVFLVGQLFYQEQYSEHQNQNQITVSGEGKVYAKPDIATVSLGLRIDGQDIKTITNDNITKVNNIIKDLKALGIDEKDIQTTQYSVTPQYNYTQYGGTVPNGYSIEQDVSVKIRDFSKIGDVLGKASGDGANTIGALQFTIDNLEKVKQDARAKAIAEAKANAQNLARESGINLGKIINVYENSNPPPIIYGENKAMGMGAAPSVAVPQIQSGQQEINVTINVTYQVN